MTARVAHCFVVTRARVVPLGSKILYAGDDVWRQAGVEVALVLPTPGDGLFEKAGRDRRLTVDAIVHIGAALRPLARLGGYPGHVFWAGGEPLHRPRSSRS